MNKIFDFNSQSLPRGVLGRSRELVWPCEMTRQSVPLVTKKVSKEYNAFELCVLRMLAYGCRDPQKIADETCLPPDLIEVILLRLYDRNKIDDHYQLTPNTLEQIENICSKKESEVIEYHTYIQFRDVIGNKILSSVEASNLKTEEIIDDRDPKSFTIKKDGRGIQLSRLHSKKSSNANDTMVWETTTDKKSEISEGEFCYLRVQMVILRNSEWRIIDPFGGKWSLDLENVYKKMIETDREEASRLLHWQKENNVEVSTPQQIHEKRPYDTIENSSLYPELIATLKRDIYANPDGKEEVDVYAAIEWALFYSIKQYDIKEFVQLFMIDTPENNQRIIDEAIDFLCKKYSTEETLKNNRNASRFIRVPLPGKLQSFQEEDMAEMQVVLPLAVLISKENSSFPLHNIMKTIPDFLSRISAIKNSRDKKKHGRSKWSEIYGENDYDFMHQVISTLLPSVIFSGDSSGHERIIDADSRLNARITMQDTLGVSAFEQMESMVQEDLLQIEMFRQNIKNLTDEKFDALRCIDLFYMAIQCVFRPLLIGKRPQPVSIEAVAQKAKDAGWGEFPQALSNVRLDMLQRTLDGNDQTLGACINAWILFTDLEILHKVAAKLPTFLLDLDSFLSLSKHRNQSCMLDKTELDSLCNKLFKILTTLTEV